MKKASACLVAISLVATSLIAGGVAWAQQQVPYWVSISASQARMRTGPGRNFPATWLYQRPGLPLRVIETFPAWRKVEDPDGTQGWMQANLLSERRTAMLRGETRALRAAPDASAKVMWRAEPGVIGTIERCDSGWCVIDVGGRRGFVESASLWGVSAAEVGD